MRLNGAIMCVIIIISCICIVARGLNCTNIFYKSTYMITYSENSIIIMQVNNLYTIIVNIAHDLDMNIKSISDELSALSWL